MNAAARLSVEERRKLLRLVTDDREHPNFCKAALSIPDKSGKVVPLDLTPAQRAINDAVVTMRIKGLPVRIRLLKSRQIHASVGCASIIWRLVSFLPGQQARVYGHLHESAKALYRYYHHFYEGYRPPAGLMHLPITSKVTDHEIRLEGGGGISFGSAENAKGGRSASNKYLHLSESAFYRDADQFRTGLLNSVPDLADSVVIDESTANGMGNAFQRGWQEAVESGGSNGWYPLFFPWHRHPEYTLALDPYQLARLQDSITLEERTLIDRHGCTFGQIAWRRFAISQKCEGDARKFQQEYPATAEEAFLTSGRTVFDMGLLSRHTAETPAIGELVEQRLGTRLHVHFESRSDGRGPLRIWEQPDKTREYVIGIDSAKGIDVNDGKRSTEDPDYSVAHVLDLMTGRQVAMLRERMEPNEFGDYIADLSRFYNYAFLVPDADGPGVAVIGALLRQDEQRQIPMDRIYTRDRDYDDARPARLQDIGFITTAVSKPQVLSALAKAFREGTIQIRDAITLQELRTFVYHADGKQAGQTGTHDDCVMALALAVLAQTKALERKLYLASRKASTGQTYQPKAYAARRYK